MWPSLPCPEGLTSKPDGDGPLPAQLLGGRAGVEAEPVDLAEHPFEGGGRDLVGAVERVAHRLAGHARGLGDVDDRGVRRVLGSPSASSRPPAPSSLVATVIVQTGTDLNVHL